MLVQKKKCAFTLAEVLITLGIIGVVAAMTIPTLMANYQKQQFLTGLKKAYSITNQALAQLALEHNCAGDLKCTGLFEPSTSNQSFGDEIAKYFKVIKNCGDLNQTNIKGCAPKEVALMYTGEDINSDFEHWYRFLTTDGMSFTFRNHRNDCFNQGVSSGKTGHLKEVCGEMIVDVNGLAKPNYLGKDIFWFYISNGKGPFLYPLGGADDMTASWKNGDSIISCCPNNPDGLGCAGRIIDSGWKMDYEEGGPGEAAMPH